MIIIPYILSIAIGSLIIHKVLRANPFSLSLILSCGTALGLGISGLLTFISLLCVGQYAPIPLVVLHIIILGILSFICLDRRTLQISTLFTYFRSKNWFDYVCIILFVIFGWILYTLASKYPFGGWDAWALWNMKMKFIVLGQKEWSYILTENHWHTQPDYPLLLACINAWLLSLTPKAIQNVPFITALLLSFITGTTVFSGLKQFIRKEIAFLATALLLCNPYYILLSTAQYADVLLALYILCSIICLFLHTKTNARGILIVAALFLGLMTFTKNEGIVISIIITGLFGLKMLIGSITNKKWNPNILWFGAGYISIAGITACYKLFLTPKNPDIVPFAKNVEYEFLNMNGFMLIVQAFLQQLLHTQWSYIWIFCIISFFCFIFRFFNKENLWATTFIIAYAFVIIMIYLTTVNFDLSWRLMFTMKRIMLYCLPAILFFTFKVIYAPKQR